jgi:ribonuclease III
MISHKTQKFSSGGVVEAVEALIEKKFHQPELLLQALTHKSFAMEKGLHLHFEKMELLGDALLDFLVLEQLMEHYPHDTEGQLSKKRASLVNQMVLDRIAREMELSYLVRLGRSEFKSDGQNKASILASVVEAILGALYLDQGLESCRDLVKKWFESKIHQEDLFKLDFKTELQEKVQAQWKKTPTYKTLDRVLESVEDSTEFLVGVFVDQDCWAKGLGKTKKEAEQKAASQALRKLKDEQ